MLSFLDCQIKRSLLGIICYLVSALVIAQQTDEKKSEQLDSVQKEIAQQKAAISKASNKRANLEKQLKTDDIAIAKVAKAIIDTQNNLNTSQKKLAELAIQKASFTAQKQKQEKLLAKQLRTAYTSGHHDYLKLILNQEQPSKVQRTVTYYQYLNKARITEIENFQVTLAALLEVTSAHQEKEDELNTLKKQQSKQKRSLQKSKSVRTKTIKALKQELMSSEQLLAKLIAEENSLVAALTSLAKQTQKQLDLNGLSKLRKKLKWPTKGRLIHRFGTKKQGYIKWKGVMINASMGQQVKAIHNGTVLFTDWLKGYGLLTVIDHGDGYMSLYGHNQTLLKSVGDRVETGEPIALVGQSGGLQNSSLYFEIRHQGKAVNPKLWCK